MEDLKEILKITKFLVDYPSVSSDKETCKKLLDDIAKMMPKNLFIKKYDFNGHGTLAITNTNDNNIDIAFCGHIDVVPCDEYKYVEDEKNIYGRGTIDMKGAVSVLIHLFKNLNTDKKVALFITSDEEIDGNCAKEISNIYPNIKLVVIPDAGKDFTLITEQKGLLQLKLSVKTKSSHASRPYDGINAIEKLYDCYKSLINIYNLPKNEDDYKTSIVLSKLIGGEALNQIPDYAEMYLDIRYTSDDKTNDIIKAIKKINSDINVEVITEGPVFKTDEKNSNIKTYIKICETVLNKKIEIKKIESTSDGIYFSEKNIPTVLMNPSGNYPHCPNEFAVKDSLLNLYKIYNKLIKEGEIK